jgi:hypothetical protein
VNIYDYFSSMERSLRSNVRIGAVEEPLICLASDDHNGLIRCRVHFWDGSFLDIYEVVSTEPGYPLRVHYAYTYLRENKCVFRYDNAPHHPEIETRPHHKHVGATEAVIASSQPTLSAVLAEAEIYLA